jgi:hypothetical protein
MNPFDERLAFLVHEAAKLKLNINADVFIKVAKGLGPSLYKDDAFLVSSSDSEELNRVKNHFLKEKLGLTNPKEMDRAISEVIGQFGSSNKNKYRVIFYYLLVEKLGKAHLYQD